MAVPRTNRFVRVSTRPKSRAPGRSVSRSVTSGGTAGMSDGLASGKTSMRAPYGILKKKNVTLKDKVKNIEKALKTNEVKYLLTNNVFYTLTTTPTVLLLNGCARGDTIQQRTGDSIRALQFEVSGIMKTTLNASIRIMIVSDKNPENTAIKFSAVTPAKNYMFAGATNANLLTYQMYNFNNTSIDEEFRVFYDKTFTLQTTNIYTQNFRIKQRIDVECEYKGGNAGTVADLTKNALYMIMWAQRDNNTDPSSDFGGTVVTMDNCLYFKDE